MKKKVLLLYKEENLPWFLNIYQNNEKYDFDTIFNYKVKNHDKVVLDESCVTLFLEICKLFPSTIINEIKPNETNPDKTKVVLLCENYANLAIKYKNLYFENCQCIIIDKQLIAEQSNLLDRFLDDSFKIEIDKPLLFYYQNPFEKDNNPLTELKDDLSECNKLKNDMNEHINKMELSEFFSILETYDNKYSLPNSLQSQISLLKNEFVVWQHTTPNFYQRLRVLVTQLPNKQNSNSKQI